MADTFGQFSVVVNFGRPRG